MNQMCRGQVKDLFLFYIFEVVMAWNDKNFDDGTEDLISYGVFLGESGGGTGKPPKNKKVL